MMLLSPFNSHPTAERRKRFRHIVLLLALVLGILIALQFSSYALLPSDKTDTLAGILTGVVLATAVVEARWARAAQNAK